MTSENIIVRTKSENRYNVVVITCKCNANVLQYI